MRRRSCGLLSALALFLQGCALSWIGEDGGQHRSGLMWVRLQQGTQASSIQASHLGLLLHFEASCASLQLGIEQTNLATNAPVLATRSLPGGWVDDAGITNHLGWVSLAYRPGEGPRLQHAGGIGVELRGGRDCLGVRIGGRDSVRIDYLDPDGYWLTDYDSTAPFATRIVPGAIGERSVE